MGDPFEKVKGGRLTFKGGAIASLSKSIDKKKKNKKKNKDKDEHKLFSLDDASEFQPDDDDFSGGVGEASVAGNTAEAAAGEGGGGGELYTIDAAKRMKYEQLFPVEAKKFAYDPKSNVKSVEDALDDRVKKKADRYCK